MLVKTALKYGLAFAAGAVATTLLTEETRRQAREFAAGVKKDMGAHAKRLGDYVENLWNDDIVGDSGKKPPEPKDPKDPPAAEA